jgi:hypothetical protein
MMIPRKDIRPPGEVGQYVQIQGGVISETHPSILVTALGRPTEVTSSLSRDSIMDSDSDEEMDEVIQSLGANFSI